MEILVESAQAIRQFLREQGYTEESLSRLGLAELHCERSGTAIGFGMGSHRRTPGSIC